MPAAVSDPVATSVLAATSAAVSVAAPVRTVVPAAASVARVRPASDSEERRPILAASTAVPEEPGWGAADTGPAGQTTWRHPCRAA